MSVASNPPREIRPIQQQSRNAAPGLVDRLRSSWAAFRAERATLKAAKRELNEAGIWRSPTHQYAGHLVIGLVVVVLLVAIGVGFRLSSDPFGEHGIISISDLATGIFGLGALLLGLQQFRLARNEVSLDKFYDRLDITNRRLEECQHARPLVDRWDEDGQEDDETFSRKMYVYREIDNLEYAIAKYRIGFMSPDNAFRALRTFRARSDPSRDFCKIAMNALVDTRGYDCQTVNAVLHVCTGSTPVDCKAVQEALESVKMTGFTPVPEADCAELWQQKAGKTDQVMTALLEEIDAGRSIRVPLVDGQCARGLRVAISRAAGRCGMRVVTAEGDGFVVVKKADTPRTSSQDKAPPSQGSGGGGPSRARSRESA